MDGLDPDGVERLREAMESHVASGAVPGLVWLVRHGDDVAVGSAGVLDTATGTPVTRDSLFRISSMTKPVTAVAALRLVDEGVLGLDEPVDRLLPELADRQVLAEPGGPLDRCVPARRPVTTRDLLTSRLGLGTDFTGAHDQPAMRRLAELGLPVGPPAPARMPTPDEYLRLLGSVPLEHQPGTRWLYHVSLDVLGVLVARAAGAPLADVLADRVLAPLGMRGTGFWVAPADLARFGPCYTADPATGKPVVHDPADGQWSAPPPFASGADGLVSTVDDLHAFTAVLRAGGSVEGRPFLRPGTVAAMLTNHLTPEQRATSSPEPGGALGWGFGLGVQVARDPASGTAAGGYGWAGGLGSTWTTDPELDLVAVLLTNQMWTSPEPPPVARDLLTLGRAAVRPD
ncbi:serine hydrolase domain-containing protein [Cellulomonas sp. 179-A 4D5 NHS]|uniref:serine hydrolase domain-containing protein n=1 Tax=Cellulomonas sp. 179-A 4D5 NHS TaxID=3142378 RepID=UPI0039A3F268